VSVTDAQWLQIGGGRVMDEVEVDAELTARRKAQPGFVEASFPTIAGTQPHLSQHVNFFLSPPPSPPKSQNSFFF